MIQQYVEPGVRGLYVELDQWELFTGAQNGMIRYWRNIVEGRPIPPNMYVDHPWQNQIEGAIAEQAFAKWMGMYWRGVGKPDTADVGPVDVRATGNHNFSLILHKWDKDLRPAYLLTGKEGKYRVRGWIYVREGKQERYWADPTHKNRWAYFVPQGVLRDPYDFSWMDAVSAPAIY